MTQVSGASPRSAVVVEVLPGRDEPGADGATEDDRERDDHDPLLQHAAPAELAVVDRQPDEQAQRP